MGNAISVELLSVLLFGNRYTADYMMGRIKPIIYIGTLDV